MKTNVTVSHERLIQIINGQSHPPLTVEAQQLSEEVLMLRERISEVTRTDKPEFLPENLDRALTIMGIAIPGCNGIVEFIVVEVE
ncbi:hypothetical protein HLB25_10290 [Dickeya dadantii]|uniref:hypothetical protein n=1 Tax=Dickeya dadantii TaxID=204038 RepID=UPI0014959C57|nr:hypothetical protein [Dickeya dadantii]NPE55898.1 hypothetical protein [Dickeya dadantii]NPE67122.1 hypothetical protein [Dickeya dadantii]